MCLRSEAEELRKEQGWQVGPVKGVNRLVKREAPKRRSIERRSYEEVLQGDPQRRSHEQSPEDK